MSLKVEQDPTVFMNSSLTQMKDELAEYATRYRSFVQGNPKDDSGKHHLKENEDMYAMRLRDELNQQDNAHRMANSKMEAQMNTLRFERDNLRGAQAELTIKYDRVKAKLSRSLSAER